jgi:hypothetical protein
MNQLIISLINLINPNQIFLINIALVITLCLVTTIWTQKICRSFLKKIHFDNVLDRVGFNGSIKKIESNINVIKIICATVQIFFIVLFSMLLCEIVNLHTLSNLLTKIILYYPNIFISILIFIISIYTIDYTQKIVVGTKTSKDITYSRFLGKIIDWSIRTLTFLAILFQLQIVPQLIMVIFTSVALAISLALGISVGLAGKDPMSRLLKEIRQSITKFF